MSRPTGPAPAAGMDTLRRILLELGIGEDEIAPGHSLRADLMLDSTETTELELALRERCGVPVDLWDTKDHTLAELAALIETAPARTGEVGA